MFLILNTVAGLILSRFVLNSLYGIQGYREAAARDERYAAEKERAWEATKAARESIKLGCGCGHDHLFDHPEHGVVKSVVCPEPGCECRKYTRPT
jgi:hypothetical protein